MPIGAISPATLEELKKFNKQALAAMRKAYGLPSNASVEKIWEAILAKRTGAVETAQAGEESIEETEG